MMIRYPMWTQWRPVLPAVALLLCAIPRGTFAQQLPPLTISELPDNRVQLVWPDSGEPLLLESSSDFGLRAAWARTADDPLLSGGQFSMTFDGAGGSNFWRLRRPDLTAPVFPAPPASPTVALGNVTRFKLNATDLSGAVTYTVEPNPLPEGTHLDEDNVFTFRPVEGMSGDFTFRFVATDRWGNTSSRDVTITVTLPPPGTLTGVTGMVVDLNSVAGGGFVPIVGARVRLLSAGTGVDTDAQGTFTLTGVPGGLQVIDISSANALPGPGGAQYAGFREHYRLIPGVMNVEDRPFFLPRLDASSLTQVVAGQSTSVVNPNLNIAMTVGANTATVEGGGAYAGQLSISAVPEELAPAKLPDELGRGSLITIQPVGVTFTTPVPITFPNRDNLPPGAGTDLWSLDPKSGTWVIVGTGRVTPDGQFVETVTGGIRAAEWHDIRPPQPCPENGGDDPDHHDPDDSCNAESGSEVSLHTGGLRTAVELPPWFSADAEQKLQLTYNSRFAFPFIIVPYNAVNSIRAAVPPTISQQVTVGGAALSFARRAVASGPGTVDRSTFYYDTRRLSEGADEVIRMAFGFDASEMETGYYRYRALVMSNYPNSSIGASFNRHCTVINETKSAFGAGWSLSSLQKLYPVPNDPNRFLVVNGNGSHLVFTKGATDKPFVIGGFSAARSGAQSFPQGSSYTTARAAVQTAFSQVSFQGLDSITAGSLALIDILVLTPITGPTTATELSAAEKTALFDWVKNGGCALICVDNDLGRAAFNMADESLISPFGITSENSTGDVVFISPENSPITSGIFGDVGRYTRAFGGRKVISPGNWGRSIAIDPQGGIGLVEVPEDEIQEGAGQVLVVTDTHLFLNNASGGQMNDDNHRILLLNTIDAFLTTQEPPGSDIVFRGPKGDFSRLLGKPDGTYVRSHIDGTEDRFSADGRLTATVDRNGNTRALTYDAPGRLIALTDEGGRVATLTYNGAKLASIVDPAGRSTQLQHDANGDLMQVTLPGGAVYHFVYDDRHLMIRETGPAGFQVDREYDGGGRLVRTVWPDGTVRTVNPVSSVAAPVPGSDIGTEAQPAPVVRRDDVRGTFSGPQGTIKAKTNNFGQEIDVTFPGERRSIIDRDANGLPTRMVFPSGEEFLGRFNRSGQRVELEDRLYNGKTTHTYEALLGQEVAYTDEFSNPWSAEIDARGNRTKITTPAARVVTATYNARGQTVALVLPSLPAGISQTYDASGALRSVTFGSGPEARTTSYTCDAAGFPAAITPPAGGPVSLTWSPTGDLSSIDYPGGRSVSMARDGTGRMIGVTPPGRPQHRLIRDFLGRVVEYRPPDGGGSIFYDHDAWGYGRITSGGRTITFTRDSAGRVTKARLGRGDYSLSFSGEAPSKLESPDGIAEDLLWKGSEVVQITYSGGIAGTLKASYDAARRVTSHQTNALPSVGFTYDADGLLTTAGAMTLTRSPVTGALTGRSLGTVSESISFNPFGEQAGLTVTAGATPLTSFARTFDKLGRVVNETTEIGGISTTLAFSYDIQGRLATVTRDGVNWYSYEYDANNNRTTVSSPAGTRTATYDSNDRILTDDTNNFVHNASGQRTARTGARPMSLSMDEYGCLLAATTPDGLHVTYKVNPAGRRIEKLINGSRSQAFLRDAYSRPVAELGPGNEIVSEFVYGSKAHVPEYAIKGGVPYFLVTDVRGSVRLVIRATTGEIVQRMDYGPFGEVLSDTNPGFQPFGYCGGLYDSDTGMVLFGLRDYDSETGRFLVRDPTLFDGGDTNLYAYVRNDPVNFLDPAGQIPVAPIVYGFGLVTVGTVYYNVAPNIQACLDARDRADRLGQHATKFPCGSPEEQKLLGLAKAAQFDAAKYCVLAGFNIPGTAAQLAPPTSKPDLVPFTINNNLPSR